MNLQSIFIAHGMLSMYSFSLQRNVLDDEEKEAWWNDDYGSLSEL